MEDTQPEKISRIGVIGTGVMGSMLCLLFAEHAGVDVSIYDRSEVSMNNAIQKAREAGLEHKVQACKSIEEMCETFGSDSKVFFFSLPHGGPGDGVVKTLQPHLQSQDIVIDGSNENYAVTHKRQGWLQSRGVSYIGMGVSGGFSGARNGPSLMPSGDERAVNRLMPLLEKIAAKDDQERPCVTNIGTGGAGHYVKMVHNGIEHGVMSALAEAWGLMHSCLGMNGDEIGDVFDSWNREGELRDNFLVAISGPICRTRNDKGKGYLLHEINDAVVQDANDSEGTGVWANYEATAKHIPAPGLSAAHFLRIASSNVSQRQAIHNSLGTIVPSPISLDEKSKTDFLEDLRKAIYAAVLACFIQGLDLLTRTSQLEGWGINLEKVVRVWRRGCIIRSDFIGDLLEMHYARNPAQNPLLGEEICKEIKSCWPSLKQVVLRGIEADAHVSVLGNTLDYLKYSGNTNLPTCFMQAQLDAFGAHGYDRKGEMNVGMAKPKYHSDWSQ